MKNMNKHILFIDENSAVPQDRRVWNEALAAKAFGYDVSVICPKLREDHNYYEQIQGIEIYRHPLLVEATSKVWYLVEYLAALFYQLFLSCKIYFKKRFHVIHAANPPDNIFLIGLVFKLFKVKYIFDHHDLCTELYRVKFGKKDFLYYLTYLSEIISIRFADVVISTNESYKQYAIVNSNGTKDSNNCFVVRNGPDLDSLTIDPPAEDYKNGFSFLVGYIGKLSKQEGIDNLLRIAAHIVEGRGIHDIKFIIMGGGPNLEDYTKMAREMNLTEYVEFTGYVPYPTLLGILQQCDIGVNPEHHNSYTDKSTMLKIMDYMLAGIPIIQFNTTEGKFTADQSSIYVSNNDEIKFADRIVEILHDESKKAEMAKIGRKRILEQLNWGIQKTNLKNAYRYLLE